MSEKVFAVSNIAWARHDDESVLALLAGYGVNGVEIAPSKVWTDLDAVSEKAASQYRTFLADHGFSVPAFQAILYGHPELQVFDPGTYPAFFARLETVARLASWLGAPVLVFGAPKNRRRNGIAYPEAFKVAADFFHKAGEVVAKYSCVLGIEANPVEYQCDFITNAADAELLVKAADSPGVALHIDSGATAMTHEDISEVLRHCGIPVVHYHISEPMLANAAAGEVDHRSALRTLKDMGYKGAVSIEMKMCEPVLPNLESALKKITEALHGAGW